MLLQNINKSVSIPFIEILAKGISFINVLLLIRIISINDYGSYSYAMAIVLWASVLMDAGITNLMFNNSLKKKLKDVNLFFTVKVFFSIIIISLILVFFHIKNPDLTPTLFFVFFIIFFSSLSSFIKLFSRGHKYFQVDVISILSEPIIRFVFLIFLYSTLKKFLWSFKQVLFFYLIAGVLAYFVNYYSLKNYFKIKFDFSQNTSFFKGIMQTLKKSIFYLLYYLMFVGISKVDLIFIEKRMSNENLALFSSSINIYQVVQLFFFAVITSQFLFFKKKPSAIYKYLIPLLIITSVSIYLISSNIYTLLFPKNYFYGYKVLATIIFAIIPSIISFYFITKNNFNNQVKVNFFILLFYLIIKLSLYVFIDIQNLALFSEIYLFIELGIALTFFIYNIFYESSPNQ